MVLTANENAVKLLSMLNTMSPSVLGSERADFLETVRNLCEQIKDFPFPKEQSLIPPKVF
jgi:hypothetical protein